jgi:hypothetical protein
MITRQNHTDPKHHERGQSLVELGISLTVILVLLAGMFDLGFALFDYIALRDAVQEGAIYGSINPMDNAGILARIQQASSAPINLATDENLDAPVVTISGIPCAGGAITISLTYHYHIVMPLLGGILGSQEIPVKATVTDTILQPDCE